MAGDATSTHWDRMPSSVFSSAHMASGRATSVVPQTSRARVHPGNTRMGRFTGKRSEMQTEEQLLERRHESERKYFYGTAMNKLGLLSLVANFAPGILQVRRTTWIAIGVGLLVIFGLLIWAAVALIGALWGQASNLAGAAPEALRGTTSGVMAQVEAIAPGARGMLNQVSEMIPGAREKLGEYLPAAKPDIPPQRDVSGMDLGPVERYPGLTRTHWNREGAQVAVEYAGKADFATVLDHYANGFAALGFAQTVLSATPGAEAHEYSKGSERLTLRIAQKFKDSVSVRLETSLQ